MNKCKECGSLYERIADREELDHINTFNEICEGNTEETVNGESFGCG